MNFRNNKIGANKRFYFFFEPTVYLHVSKIWLNQVIHKVTIQINSTQFLLYVNELTVNNSKWKFYKVGPNKLMLFFSDFTSSGTSQMFVHFLILTLLLAICAPRHTSLTLICRTLIVRNVAVAFVKITHRRVRVSKKRRLAQWDSSFYRKLN